MKSILLSGLFLAAASIASAVSATLVPQNITFGDLLKKEADFINEKCGNDHECEELELDRFVNPYSNVSNTDDQCGFPESTIEMWQTLNVTNWTRRERELDASIQANNTGDHGSHWYREIFVKKWFGNTSPMNVACDVVGDCVLSCLEYTPSLRDHEDMGRAWLFSQHIARWYQLRKAALDATHRTFTKMSLEQDALTTDLSSIDEAVVATNLRMKQAKLLISLVQSMCTAIILFGGAFADGPTDSVIAGVAIAVWTGVNGAISAGLAYSAVSVDGWEKAQDAMFGSIMGQVFGFMTDLVINHTFSALRFADPIEPSAMFLEQELAGGMYAHKDVDLVEFQDVIETYITAIAMNWLWGPSASHAYIIAADADRGRCADDIRGPQWTKVCFSDDDPKVYYAYSLSRSHEVHGFGEHADVWEPPGVSKLMDPTKNQEYNGITLRSAVMASVNYYEKYKNARRESPIRGLAPPALMGMNEFLSFRGTEARLDDNRLDLNGLMDIAVCNNPGGEMISAIGSDGDKNYPCMCGTNDVHHDLTPPYDYNKDESAGFLIASGIGASNDWEGYCQDIMGCWGKHQNHNTWDTYLGGGVWKGVQGRPYTKCERFQPHCGGGLKRDPERGPVYEYNGFCSGRPATGGTFINAR